MSCILLRLLSFNLEFNYRFFKLSVRVRVVLNTAVLVALTKICHFNDSQDAMPTEFNLPLRESNVIIIKKSPTLSYAIVILLSTFESLVLVGNF